MPIDTLHICVILQTNMNSCKTAIRAAIQKDMPLSESLKGSIFFFTGLCDNTFFRFYAVFFMQEHFYNIPLPSLPYILFQS